MAEQYRGMAIGIFELDSECACFVALDAAAKAAAVQIQGVERNRLGAGACVKMRVEVLGEANAVLVLDRMLKTAEVSYETQDTKCGGHALIFVSGSVSAVQAAVESIKEAPPCKVFQTAVISNPSQEMVQIVEGFKARKKK